MAWTTPMTFTSGSVLTAAQLNTHLRDNINETAVAKATAAGRIYVSTGANQLAERVPSSDFVGTSETSTSVTYADLATPGPTVTCVSGVRAIVFINARQWGSGNTNIYTSYAVSGATTIAGSDAKSIITRIVTGGDAGPGERQGVVTVETSLTPGSNTFAMKYRTNSGAITGVWQDRHLLVIPL